jgi:Phage integrase, N-terminal SAM-like domain
MAEISPLRRRMIEDMTVRNLSPATQQSYLNAVSKFSRYFGRCPDLLGHASLASTARYTRVATKTISNTPSPLDRLRLEVVPPS